MIQRVIETERREWVKGANSLVRQNILSERQGLSERGKNKTVIRDSGNYKSFHYAWKYDVVP